MKAYVTNLGDVCILHVFLCGAYKYGYVGKYFVRYDYQLGTWSIACVIQYVSKDQETQP